MSSSISFQNKNFASKQDPETLKKSKFDGPKITSKPLEINSIATNSDKYKHQIVSFTNRDPGQDFLDSKALNLSNKVEKFRKFESPDRKIAQ